MTSSLERFGGASVSAASMSAPGNQGGNPVFQNLPAIQNDPVGVLRAVGLNVPDSLSPQSMADYLVRTGQVGQAELNRVINTARMMGAKI